MRYKRFGFLLQVSCTRPIFNHRLSRAPQRHSPQSSLIEFPRRLGGVLPTSSLFQLGTRNKENMKKKKYRRELNEFVNFLHYEKRQRLPPAGFGTTTVIPVCGRVGLPFFFALSSSARFSLVRCRIFLFPLLSSSFIVSLSASLTLPPAVCRFFLAIPFRDGVDVPSYSRRGHPLSLARPSLTLLAAK